ncbi:MAG: DUF882 domain-containing protein [Gammaproteobacteria bacterium]|nr:DUF882 domain-containing protein [Gammaproteobacteria bacterium]
MDRRRFIGAAATSSLGLLSGRVSATPVNSDTTKVLELYNRHTGEQIRTEFWAENALLPEGLTVINQLLRDHRTNEVMAMDPALLHLIHQLRKQTGSRKPLDIISGYRSPKTNAALRAKSGGVAKKSFHMRGMAVDIALPGTDLRALLKLAKSLRGGGVGYYPKSGFLHLDTGPVRYWS